MWEEKGTTETEMVGWHHRLNAHEFEQALGIGAGQGHPSFFPSPHHPILIHSIINSYEPGHHNVSQICLLLSISSTDILSQVKVSFCLDFL